MKATLLCDFFVPGKPQPRGSKIPSINRHTGRTYIRDDNSESASWMGTVRDFARRAYSGPPTSDPVAVQAIFYLRRPKGHYGKQGNLLPSAPRFITTKPDATKIWRGTEDALSGVIWVDDNQVCDPYTPKRYAEDGRVGVWIRVWRLEADPVPDQPKVRATPKVRAMTDLIQGSLF